MNGTEVFQVLVARFGESKVLGHEALLSEAVTIAPESLREVSEFLRDDDALGFDFLRAVTGVDRKDCIEVVYQLYSYSLRHGIAVKVKLDREAPVVDSVHDIWPTANWHERETFDLFGVTFSGHPDLRRLLLPEDWEGYPLRKDYKFPTSYRGMPV